MKKYLVSALIGLSFSSHLYAFADDSASLRDKLAKIASIKADFHQQVTDINHRKIQSGEGILALATPNKLYWHLTSPDESLIVSDGETVWLYNPFAEEVTAMDMQDAMTASPITLLVHKDKATWDKYLVKKNQDCYSIKPKDADAQITQVNVCFNENTINKLTIADIQGNLSQFSLSSQQMLTAKDKGLFNFNIPEGVELDDQRSQVQ